MCKCTPGIKTPFCGKVGCEWPKQTNYVAINNGEAVYLQNLEQALEYVARGYVILKWKPLRVERKVVILDD